MLRWVVLALTAVTGFTGLAYEVTWQKYLGVLLGAHSEATAAVLGLFLGGLSLGYWVLGALARALIARGRRQGGRPAPLLAVYGAIEAGVGVWCLLFPSLFPLVRTISVVLPTGDGAFAFAVDVALAALLIVPPAMLMGGTIPFLTQALARDLADATRVHALIYACNTAGAFLGTLATGFFLIHWLGLAGVLHTMGLVNVGVGAVFARLGYRRREVVDLDSGGAAPLPGGMFAVYGSAALLVGFAMMVLQTTAIRIGGLALGSSEYTFTMVVAVFVLCIALGSIAVSALPRIGRSVLPVTLWGLGLLFTALYPALETAPYWFHVLRVIFRDLAAAFYPFQIAAFAVIALVIGPAVVLSGAALPLLFHALRHEVGDLGSQAGRLYSVNTVGSLLGALIGGYVLLIWLDLHHIYRIAVGALVLAAAIITVHQVPAIRIVGGSLLLLSAIAGLERLPPWHAAYLVTGAFREREPTPWTFEGPSVFSRRRAGTFSFYDDDPNTSVAVQDFVWDDQQLTRSILVNGKSDGNSAGDYTTTALLALVPALFAERAENAFVIGFGTGVTAGVLAGLEETQAVTVAEISSGVITAAPLFDFANGDASTHPKVRFVHSDAYRALVKGRGRYDVIVSEPSNPWVTGIEQLYSREFIAEARARLTPGGVFCQWFHLYEVSAEAIELVLRTYASVFDHVAVWAADPADLILLGFQDVDRALDVERLERRARRADFAAVLNHLAIGDFPSLLAHEVIPVGVVHAASLRGPLHSLYRPLLGFAAGRAFFVGEDGELPFTGYGDAAETGAANSLLRRDLARRDGAERQAIQERVATYACRTHLPGCGAHAAAVASTGQQSDLFETLQVQLQRQRGPGFVRRLRLLRDGAGAAATTRIRPAAAVAITRLFMREYSHGAPLAPAALLTLWERCGLDAAGIARCAPGLRAAERLMIGDRPPDPDEWLNPERQREASAQHVRPEASAGEDADW